MLRGLERPSRKQDINPLLEVRHLGTKVKNEGQGESKDAVRKVKARMLQYHEGGRSRGRCVCVSGTEGFAHVGCRMRRRPWIPEDDVARAGVRPGGAKGVLGALAGPILPLQQRRGQGRGKRGAQRGRWGGPGSPAYPEGAGSKVCKCHFDPTLLPASAMDPRHRQHCPPGERSPGAGKGHRTQGAPRGREG